MRISRFVRTAAAVGLAVGLGSLAASKAFAETKTGQFEVDATVVKNCKVTTSPIQFTGYDVFNVADTDATGGVTIACTKGVPATISLSGTQAARKLTGPGGAQLSYGLFSNSGRTTAWDS